MRYRHVLRHGHAVVVPIDRTARPTAQTLVLPPLSQEEVMKALIATGTSEDKSRELARLARKSLSCFRRRTAVCPEVRQPTWACPESGPSSVPAMLAGAWKGDSEADRQVLSALAHTSYEDLTAALTRWCNEADAPVRHVGDAWYLVSLEDAWSPPIGEPRRIRLECVQRCGGWCPFRDRPQ